jgi:hypothetical protein
MATRRPMWILLLLATGCSGSDFTLQPATELAEPGAEMFDVMIVGGEPADGTAWPATFVFSRGPCTGTAVGRYVLLVAAHCVEDGASGKVKTSNGPIRATCKRHPTFVRLKSHHPQWEQLTSPDFALCDLSHPLDRVLPGVEYEHVNLDASAFTAGDTLHLVGFGCTQVGGKPFQGLYEGDASVTRLPPADGYFTFTEDDVGLCDGDSGGGAYLVKGNARHLVAVNSHGDEAHARRSALATTGVAGFGTWARDWASKRHVKICGLHADAEGCRTQ